jgi:hypothetical protein
LRTHTKPDFIAIFALFVSLILFTFRKCHPFVEPKRAVVIKGLTADDNKFLEIRQDVHKTHAIIPFRRKWVEELQDCISS